MINSKVKTPIKLKPKISVELFVFSRPMSTSPYHYQLNLTESLTESMFLFDPRSLN